MQKAQWDLKNNESCHDAVRATTRYYYMCSASLAEYVFFLS